MVGARIDSHDFMQEVAEKGCRLFVVEKEIPEEQLQKLPEGTSVVRVDSAREALAHLSAARFGFPAEKMTCIGVTGTKGKTTTTYMIKAILEAAGKKVGLIGTAGAVIGDRTFPTMNTTPESYELQHYFAQMVEEGCEYMVMEVSSQGLKMHRVDGINFDYGMFTNISNDHIGPNEHADFAEYLYWKCQLLKKCRVAIVNRDDEHFEEICRNAGRKVFTYSLEQDADFMAKDIHYVAEPDFVGLDFDVTGQYELNVKVNIPGRFNVYNALAATCVAEQLGLSMDEIKCGIAAASTISGRTNLIHTKGMTVIDDCYNANPVSMKASLDVLSKAGGRKIAVLGDMGELGEDEKQLHYEVGTYAGTLPIDLLFCVGTLSGKLAEGAKKQNPALTVKHYATREEMTEELLATVKEGDAVLVKASHFMEFPKVVAALTEA